MCMHAYMHCMYVTACSVTVVDDRLIMSAIYRLPVTFGKNWPTLQCSLSAIAEIGLLVKRVNAQTAGVYRHW